MSTRKAPSAHRIAAMLTLAAAAAFAATAGATGLPPELVAAIADYDRAQVEGDTGALERLFTEDYVLVNSDASVEDKRQAIADFRLPGFRIEPYVVEEPVEIAWRDGAVVGGLVHLRWTQEGRRQQRLIRIAHTWAKRDGRWQMAYTQVTRVPH